MSASASKDHYYTSSLGKSRRSSPGVSQGNPYSFQAGQGGRTVLPPFSTAFPNLPFPGPYPNNAYTAPRSSPGRGHDINPQAFNYPAQWSTGNSPSVTPAFTNYDTTSSGMYAHDRHSPQPYPSYTTARASPPLINHTDPRRLPPLATSSSPGGDRWQQSAQNTYGAAPAAVYGYPTTGSGNIRSPAASYPNQFYQGSTYGYQLQTQYDQLSLGSHAQANLFDDLDSLQTGRSSSSYVARAHGSSQASSANYTPPPVSPTSPEEPTIKKKRKRADAAQLKVLNETYARTAFPSTEERHALAKALDMSARSVQIWFQNKRQSMRQTNRQSSTVSPSAHQQTYGMQTSQSERMMDDLGHPSNYGGGNPLSLPEAPYMGGSMASNPSSTHRRARTTEEGDHQRQWPRGY